ncbi:hypothetical protein [Rhodococcus sp. Q]|uniref:hypothetical protein n=1 Tax=Rhodococcus sp. Q TaxID=2502252 RepID=UPI0010F83E29|nr:hypothetical protein [Rhodococcus sp. Q]
MTGNEDTVVVFTAKSPEQILREGGSQSWKLDPTRATKCEWLVCTQNAHNFEDYADGTEPHGSAFLIGRISRISPATDTDGRWLIEIGEYARVSQPDVWGGERNPVRYTNFDSLGISLEDVKFQATERRDAAAAAQPSAESTGLTITQAKAGLAKTYGVDPNSIEIVIRG